MLKTVKTIKSCKTTPNANFLDFLLWRNERLQITSAFILLHPTSLKVSMNT